MSTTALESVNIKRDVSLDIYRALIMIYILCVIHVGYWLNFISEPISSIILFEMPVIFFISGASLNVTKRRRSFKNMLVNRFKRIAVPYYIYIALSLIVAAVFSAFIPQIFECNLNLKSLLDIITFRTPEGFKIPFFYHTWFVLPYLLIYILFWYEQKICDVLNPWLVSASLLIVCLLLQFNSNSFIKIISIYNFFFVIGYLFYRKLSVKKIFLVTLLSLGCIIVYSIKHLWGGVMH